jgi:multidrug efflux pump subunit AcrA (membrane-fusion protein)
MRRLLTLLLLVLAGGGAYAAYHVWSSRPLAVTIVRPHMGSAADVVYATGVVEPVRWAKVTSVLRERIIELCSCEGEAVEAGEVIGRLDSSAARATLAELEARAQLSEQELVRTGQETVVRADAFPQASFDARVDRITPKGDPVLKTYRVYLAFPQETPLMIGMTSDVNIVVREVAETMLVPLAALDGDKVLVLGADGMLEERVLEVGIRGVDEVEVLSGLTLDERVVSPWAEGLAAGMRARPATGDDAVEAGGDDAGRTGG